MIDRMCNLFIFTNIILGYIGFSGGYKELTGLYMGLIGYFLGFTGDCIGLTGAYSLFYKGFTGPIDPKGFKPKGLFFYYYYYY